jgi:hypothetical protein
MIKRAYLLLMDKHVQFSPVNEACAVWLTERAFHDLHPHVNTYDTLSSCLNIYHFWLFVGNCNFLWAARNVKYILPLLAYRVGLPV